MSLVQSTLGTCWCLACITSPQKIVNIAFIEWQWLNWGPLEGRPQIQSTFWTKLELLYYYEAHSL